MVDYFISERDFEKHYYTDFFNLLRDSDHFNSWTDGDLAEVVQIITVNNWQPQLMVLPSFPDLIDKACNYYDTSDKGYALYRLLNDWKFKDANLVGGEFLDMCQTLFALVLQYNDATGRQAIYVEPFCTLPAQSGLVNDQDNQQEDDVVVRNPLNQRPDSVSSGEVPYDNPETASGYATSVDKSEQSKDLAQEEEDDPGFHPVRDVKNLVKEYQPLIKESKNPTATKMMMIGQSTLLVGNDLDRLLIKILGPVVDWLAIMPLKNEYTRQMDKEILNDNHYDADQLANIKEAQKKSRKWAFGLYGIFTIMILLFHWWAFGLVAIAITYIIRTWWSYSTSVDNSIPKMWKPYLKPLLNAGKIKDKDYWVTYPVMTYKRKLMIERFLKSGKSGAYASDILEDSVIISKLPNGLTVADISLSTDLQRHVVKSVDDHELTEYGMLPMVFNSMGNAYYEAHSTIRICLDYWFGQIGSDQLIAKIAEDPNLAGAYKELADMLEQQRLQAEEETRKQQEAKELAEMKADVEIRGLPATVANMLMVISKNKSDWGFNYWRVGKDGLTGNDRYIKARMRLLQGTSLKQVNALKPKIEAELRHQIMLKPLSDKGSFQMTILIKPDLAPFKLKVANIKEFANNNQLYFGEGLTGPMVSNWNDQANHMIISGKSGSGKTVTILSILTNMVMMKDYNYKNLIITSSSKVGDFAEFRKAGAYVGAGLDEILKTATAVLNEAKRREKLFADEEVSNLSEYNKKHSDNPMPQVLYLVDELENALNSSDTKKSKAIQATITEGLNIFRSSGITFIGAGQTPLKSRLGDILDKLSVKVVGSNNKNVTDQFSTEISDYYSTLTKKPQGVFFLSAENLELPDDTITFGNTNYTLLQTPYILDISTKTLPKLTGQSFMEGADTTGLTNDSADEEEIHLHGSLF